MQIFINIDNSVSDDGNNYLSRQKMSQNAQVINYPQSKAKATSLGQKPNTYAKQTTDPEIASKLSKYIEHGK